MKSPKHENLSEVKLMVWKSFDELRTKTITGAGAQSGRLKPSLKSRLYH